MYCYTAAFKSSYQLFIQRFNKSNNIKSLGFLCSAEVKCPSLSIVNVNLSSIDSVFTMSCGCSSVLFDLKPFYSEFSCQ